MTHQSIQTLSELREAISQIYEGIEQDCMGCEYPDCKGFLYLLEDEVDAFLDAGLEVVRINNAVNLMHNFDTDENGNLILGVTSPKCKQRCAETGLCKINHMKPIICSLYPILPDTDPERNVYWALHMDCKFSERIHSEGKFETLQKDFMDVMARTEASLYKKIVDAYHEIDKLCYFPEGYNRILKVGEV